MTSEPPICPDCGQDLKFGGFVLLRREDDDERTCRSLWKCPNKKHMWWHWADRPEEPLEVCPVPHLFR